MKKGFGSSLERQSSSGKKTYKSKILNYAGVGEVVNHISFNKSYSEVKKVVIRKEIPAPQQNNPSLDRPYHQQVQYAQIIKKNEETIEQIEALKRKEEETERIRLENERLKLVNTENLTKLLKNKLVKCELNKASAKCITTLTGLLETFFTDKLTKLSEICRIDNQQSETLLSNIRTSKILF